MRVSVSLDLHQHLLLSPFIVAILIDVNRCGIVVLICVFLISNDVEFLFLCTVCIHSSEEGLLEFLVHVSIELSFLLLCHRFLCTLDIKILVRYMIHKDFSAVL
jgi:hypothetical protein